MPKSRAPKEPKKTVIFALDTDQVQENDIVLLLNTPWGHAALCTQAHALFEAMPAGLHRRSVFATYVKRRDHIQVLRPTPALAQNTSGQRIADYAEALYGQAYNVPGALLAVVPRLRTGAPGSYFCSQVIAQIFVDYGLNLLPAMRPDKVKPRDFLTATAVLENVSERCVRKIDAVVDGLEFDSILETAAESAWAVREMKMNRTVFEACMKRLGRHRPTNVYSLRALWEWFGSQCQSTHPDSATELESALLQTMQSGGYWEFYQQLHERREAKRVQHGLEIQRLLDPMADGERVDQWLSIHRDVGFSLPLRKQYLAAFCSWAQVTKRDLFKRLAETFATQTRDTELEREQYETLRAARASYSAAPAPSI